jgi:hypothetical protein
MNFRLTSSLDKYPLQSGQLQQSEATMTVTTQSVTIRSVARESMKNRVEDVILVWVNNILQWYAADGRCGGRCAADVAGGKTAKTLGMVGSGFQCADPSLLTRESI